MKILKIIAFIASIVIFDCSYSIGSDSPIIEFDVSGLYVQKGSSNNLVSKITAKGSPDAIVFDDIYKPSYKASISSSLFIGYRLLNLFLFDITPGIEVDVFGITPLKSPDAGSNWANRSGLNPSVDFGNSSTMMVPSSIKDLSGSGCSAISQITNFKLNQVNSKAAGILLKSNNLVTTAILLKLNSSLGVGIINLGAGVGAGYGLSFASTSNISYATPETYIKKSQDSRFSSIALKGDISISTDIMPLISPYIKYGLYLNWLLGSSQLASPTTWISKGHESATGDIVGYCDGMFFNSGSVDMNIDKLVGSYGPFIIHNLGVGVRVAL